jgi:hypothetical protein
MDEIQLIYKRLFNYTDDDLKYKNFIIRGRMNDIIKREIVSACCYEHARHLKVLKKYDKVLSIIKE